MDTLDNQAVSEAVYRLVNAPDAGAVRHVLGEFRWLISAEVEGKLTQVIVNKREIANKQDEKECQKEYLTSAALFAAARGFLRRCRLECIDTACERQPGWPLAREAPLARLLALAGDAPADERIERANAALRDVAQDTEPDIYGFIHYHLGQSYRSKADAGLADAFAPAIEHFEKALEAWQSDHSHLSQLFRGRAQYNLGYLSQHKPGGGSSQHVERAIAYLNQAKKSLEPSDSAYIDVLVQRGTAYLNRIVGERLHNIEEAIQCYDEAHGLAQQNENRIRLAEIEHSLAVAHRLRLRGRRAENIKQARKWAERALNRLDRREEPDAWARTTAELATIYGHRQYGSREANLEKAIGYALEALAVYHEDTHPRQWTLVQLHLGNLYCDRIAEKPKDNYQKAIAHFKVVRDKRDKENDPLGWAEAMNNLGTAFAGLAARARDDYYQKAVTCFTQVLGIYKPEYVPARTRRTAANWGNLAFRFQQWEEARNAFQTAWEADEALFEVSGTEAGRRVELTEGAGIATRRAFCLLKLGSPEEAFLQLEPGKTRLLAEALALGNIDLAMLPQTEREAVQDAREKVRVCEADMRLQAGSADFSHVKLGQRLVEARAKLRQLIEEARQDHPGFMPRGLELRDTLALIPEGGALVAPLVTAQGSAAFVLPHGIDAIEDEHVLPLKFTESDLQALLIGNEKQPGWMRMYTDRRSDDWMAAWQAAITLLTRQLWQNLMGPIHERLVELGVEKDAPIIMLPQGGLGLLPLHAAWYQANERQRTFLDHYVVNYAPSAYALQFSQSRMERGHDRPLSLLAVVNPTHDLTSARMEGDIVAGLFPLDRSQKLLTDEAKKTAVVASAAGQSYVHFACHGRYDWHEIMASALALADGPLTLAEIISRLDLNMARLVVLSACETGLSEFEELPDEYLGLPAGILQAGAAGVISTLWAVDDSSTVRLMAHFYRMHLIGDMAPAAALRAAQLWLREKRGYQNPYYWAAFTFNGCEWKAASENPMSPHRILSALNRMEGELPELVGEAGWRIRGGAIQSKLKALRDSMVTDEQIMLSSELIEVLTWYEAARRRLDTELGI